MPERAQCRPDEKKSIPKENRTIRNNLVIKIKFHHTRDTHLQH